ncbi:Hypothetical predicted protein [Mytilus galloprovincialis]|uniref:Laccase n=2 Tax=Mytilus galloprovincialis TaxID=29158 RepID=A0A8B6BMM0_MYTGA|nr:Hypothetical predicted protein [Mytilus galloprovincialis]
MRKKVDIMKLLLFLLFVTLTTAFECDPHAKICETSLDIHYELAMMSEDGPVYAHNGKLFLYNVTDTANASPYKMDEIMTADGWEGSSGRLIVSANKSLPGPPIIVYEGQTVIINVHNNQLTEATSIHWHGVDMKDTPWMDGPPYITQCPIGPGQTFKYKFTANPPGTFWYHSHMGHQRLNGLFGAFIIRPKLSNKIQLEEHIMQVFEWNHEYGSDADDLFEEAGGTYINRTKLLPSMQLGMSRYTPYRTHAGLINGRGRFWSGTSNNGAPLETFKVTKGKQYLFRVIGPGALYPWRVSVDQHNLTIVGADGYETVPVVAESFVIAPGERFNFILNADQPIGTYMVRAETLDRRYTTKAEAILQYEGAMLSEPTSSKSKCTSSNKCIVVNCPFPFYPENENVNCTRLTELRTVLNILTPLPVQGKFKEYFLNFAFPGYNGEEGPASVNGRQFKLPDVSALTQPDELPHQCTDQECGEEKLCQCMNSLTINSGDTIQMTFLNMGQGRVDDHPVHMHGHAFMVIKVGYGVFNKSTGALIEDNNDVDCRGNTKPGMSMCNSATWSNSSWLNGNVPGIVQQGAVLKDTVIVPSGGYVVVRFPATIPGIWFLHCHIDMHSNDGMAIVLNESFASIPKPPPGLPKCGSYLGNDVVSDVSDTNEPVEDFNDHVVKDEDSESDKDENTTLLFGGMFSVLFVLNVVQFIVLLVTCRRQNQDRQHDKAFAS